MPAELHREAVSVTLPPVFSFEMLSMDKYLVSPTRVFLPVMCTYLTQMVSISTSAPRGRAPTSTAERAGYWPSVKNSAYHIVHGETGGLQNSLHVGQHLTGLLGDAAGHKLAGSGVKGHLAGGDQKAAAVDSLRIGADGSRSIIGSDDLLHDVSLL